jgi:hypothetical protein
MAIRRHWELVSCAFCFCWWAQLRSPNEAATERQEPDPISPVEPCVDAPEPKRPVPQAEEAAGEKGEATAPASPPTGEPEARSCWPLALRRVRSRLTPRHFLWRGFRAWSDAPPPPPLQALLDAVAMGRPLNLYLRC